MWQEMRKRLGARDGFTLIELVVVVAILGVLAIVVTPKVTGALDNAKQKTAASNAKQVQIALERLYADTGAYPTYATLCGAGTAPACALPSLKTGLVNIVNIDTTNLTSATYTTGTNSFTLTMVYSAGGGGKTYTITQDAITASN
ncbi:MAG: pilE [Symbiobacteriaceae bacterium]|jgi:type II secretion system protein G|nr:pilE [Symbiobacteriaceae bacterium]